jgi:hypothetical protein
VELEVGDSNPAKSRLERDIAELLAVRPSHQLQLQSVPSERGAAVAKRDDLQPDESVAMVGAA